MIILVAGTSNWNNLLQLLGVSILFLFILAITYYTTKFVGGYKMGVSKNSNFKVIETHKVTQNKYLQIVQVGKHYFVIAIGKDEISLISEIKEEELILREPSKKQTGNFKDIMNLMINKEKEKDKPDEHSL